MIQHIQNLEYISYSQYLHLDDQGQLSKDSSKDVKIGQIQNYLPKWKKNLLYTNIYSSNECNYKYSMPTNYDAMIQTCSSGLALFSYKKSSLPLTRHLLCSNRN